MFSLIPWRRKEGEEEQFFAPMARMHQDMNSLFNQLFPLQTRWGYEVEDTGKELVYQFEAPGFEPEQFEINMQGNALTIKAETKEESEEKENSFKSHRYLERSVVVPTGTDSEKIEATYRNGILEVRVPRTPEAQAKKIPVKV